MLDKTFFNSIKKKFFSKDKERRLIIKESSDVLHTSKRAIFALHRGNAKDSKQLIAQAVKGLKAIERRLKKHPELRDEGSLRAAQEELVEAHIFYMLVHGKRAGKIVGVEIPHQVYLAGLADVPGELVRYAIREATARRHKTVKDAQKALDHIMDYMAQYNFTSYLRTKYDQAKQMMKKMEEISYQVSHREK